MKHTTGLLSILIILMIAFSCQKAVENKPGQNHVILITLDGLRWQELFTGADSSLINDRTYVHDSVELAQLFWSEDMDERRLKLMPFFWTEIASNGVLMGNRNYGSKVNVTNNQWFSYPGYNEILAGFADENIDSNDKIDNPNETVLEFVNKQPGFENRVSAFASWDVFPFIINESRSGVYVNAGFEPTTDDNLTEKEELLNKLQEQIPRTWNTVRVDAFTHHYALEYIFKHKPRLVYISYGETDDFAHEGRYDQYLKSARQTDAFIKELWQMVNSDPEYAGSTSFLITTDHGRGSEPKDSWRSHGTSIDGADQIWFAAIGPMVKTLGESKTEQQFFQNQVAATVAAMLGLKYESIGEEGPEIKEILE